MGWFSRRKPAPVVESRRIDDIAWLPFNQGGSGRNMVGEFDALHSAPVFAAIRHIVTYCSTLGIKQYRKDGLDKRQQIPLSPLFARLEREGRLVAWFSQGFQSLVVHGNAVAEIIERDAAGLPVAAVWLPASRVTEGISSSGLMFENRPLNARDIIHVPWISVPGRVLGLSPLEYFANTVLNGRAAVEFSTAAFQSGGMPPSVLKNTARTLDSDSARAVRAKAMVDISSRTPLVLGKDWEFAPVTLPANHLNFIETIKMTANQIAAIYGIDPDEIGGQAANSLTYSTEELRQIKRAANMRPYLVAFESVLSSKLSPTGMDSQFVKFNTDSAIRADLKTRTEVQALQISAGIRTVDEVRALEDLPPLPKSQLPVASQQIVQESGQENQDA